MTEQSKTKKFGATTPRQAILKWIPQTAANRDEREHLANILFGEIKLPGAAFLDPKLLDIVGSAESTIEQLQECIKAAPDLSIAIVRMAQSAYYNRGGEVNSFEDACNRIGMKVIRNLVYAHQVASSFTKFESQINWESFWMNSILTARLSEQLMNSYVGPKNLGFLVGLIGNVGSIIIQEFFPQHYLLIQEKVASGGGHVSEAEMEYLGFNHAHVAGVLCMKWNFPTQATLGVYYHHTASAETEAHEGAQIAMLSMCCLAADRMAEVILASDLTKPFDNSWMAETPEWNFLSRHHVVRQLNIVPEDEYRASQAIVASILAQLSPR